MNDLILVKAKIKILTIDEGGTRKTGILSGYRPNHVFDLPQDGKYVTFIGDIRFDDVEFIYPGEEQNVMVRFVRNQAIEKYIINGAKWWMYEVPNLIAEAEILEIL
ncbi:MAG: hypothetical protein V4577_27275 [Bacteroidota bacterium]